MKIAATIVTYNRLILLKRTVHAVQNQSYKPDKIIIINNGSTDNTSDWLMELDSDDIIVVNQHNAGSGGGQRTALLTAFNLDYDYIWTMDDDGLPENMALEKLVDTVLQFPDLKVLNSLVIDIDNPETIAFGYDLGGNFFRNTKGTRVRNLLELKKMTNSNRIIEGIPQFFNSTFLHKSIIPEVGLPIPELFIRGDEVEYIYRIQSKQIKTYTVVDSIMFHPNPKYDHYKYLRNKISLSFEKIDSIKRYYAIRNRLIIEKYYKHFPLTAIMKIMLKEFLYVAIYKNQLNFSSEIKNMFLAFFDAFKFRLNEKIELNKLNNAEFNLS